MATIVGQLILYIKFVSHRNGVIDKNFSFSTEFFFFFFIGVLNHQSTTKLKQNPGEWVLGILFLIRVLIFFSFSILGILFFFFFF